MLETRAQIETRLQALLADYLDHIERDHPDGFDLGVAAIVAEVRSPAEVEDVEALVSSRGRPEATYTPEAQWLHYVSFLCSDSRAWIQAGLLQAALDVVDEDDEADEENQDA